MNIYSPGVHIAGRYEIAGRPLMGGMGIVYLCFDHQKQRPVALKTFRPEYLPDRAARERFLREGTVWVNLGRHPHIVRAYGVERIGDGREVYLVLELVAKEEGRQDASLRSWLLPGRPLPVQQVLLFGLQIARGMIHATTMIPGFVHRDLKPENILVGADRLSGVEINRLRITDFGLVRALSAGKVLPSINKGKTLSDCPGLTRIGAVMGTPSYMAPEQWDRTDVDLRADIYALGCILGEMLMGRALVREQTLGAFQRAHQEGRDQERIRNLPKECTKLLVRCLAVELERRYTNWEEIEATLVRVYEQQSGRRVPTGEMVEERGIRVDRVEMGWSYSAIGASYLDIGKAEVALEYFNRAREIGQAEEERRLEAAGLGSQGLACAVLGDMQKAIRLHEQHLEIAREIDDLHGIGVALGNLGTAYKNLGNARKAIEFYKQDLEIVRKIGNRHGEANALMGLGLACADLGDLSSAIGFYEQALVIAREIGDRRGEGKALGNLGGAYADLGKVRQAVGYFEQALAILRELGDRHGEGSILCNLGIAYKNLGNAQQAIGFYEQSLMIAREIGDRRGEGETLVNLGVAYDMLGDARLAIGYLEQALAILHELGHRHAEGVTLTNLGTAYLNLGDAQRAMGCYEQRLEIAQEIGDLMGVVTGLFNMAYFLAQQSHFSEALPYAEQAVQIAEQMGYTEDARRDHQLAAQIRAMMR